MTREAGMGLLVHQALKDARLVKWFLAVWVLLNVAVHLLVFVGVQHPPPDQRQVSAEVTAYFTLYALLVAGFVAIPVIVLQADPAVGTTAFWFTRPIKVRVLLGGKLLLIVPAVVLLPVLLDVLALWIGGVPLRAMGGPVLEGLVLQVVWLLPVMAIAAFTTDLAQFVLGVILEVVAFIVVTFIVPWVQGVKAPSRLFTAQAVPVFVVVLAALSFAVLAFAYLSRSLRRSAVAAGAAPVILGVLLLAWPADLRPAFEPRGRSPAEVRPVAVWRVAPAPNVECAVAASLALSAVPSTQAVEMRAYDAWLQVADNRIDIDRLYVSAPENGEDQAPTALRNAVRGTSGAVPGGQAVRPDRFYSVFVGFPASTCRDHANERATLHIGIRLTPAEYRVAAALPLRAGATWQIDAGRGEVLDVSRAQYAISVRMRQTGLEPWRTGIVASGIPVRSTPTVRPVLVGPRPDEVMLAVKSTAAVSPFLSMIIPVPQHLASTWWTLDFPDADWLNDARLAIVESRRLGAVERHIEIPNIVLSSLPEQGPTR